MVSVFVVVLLVATAATVLNLARVQGQQGVQSFSATLAGSPNKSNSTGTANFQVNENSSKISYWINVTGIRKINQAHIHNGTTGQNGDIIVSLLTKSKSAKGKATSPEIGFSGNISKGDLSGLLKGKEISELVSLMSNGSAYVNIHTDKYPNGAIRGQITTSGMSESGASSAQPNATNASATTTEQPRGASTSPDSQDSTQQSVTVTNQSTSAPNLNKISVTTDKQTYNPHETVNINIKNIGTQQFHFSGTNSEIQIRNLKTNETFIPSPLLLSSLIPSGSSKIITWNQEDFSGHQVVSGNYRVEASMGVFDANSTFSIS